MDTKSKSSRPLIAWFSFFLGISLALVLLITSTSALVHSRGDTNILKAPYIDYQDTVFFTDQTQDYFNMLLAAVPSGPEYDEDDYEQMLQSWTRRFSQEGDNIKYYAENSVAGAVFKNISGDVDELIPALGSEYGYYWYYDGNKLRIMDHGQEVDTKYIDFGSENRKYQIAAQPAGEPGHIKIVLAVKDNLTAVPNSYRQSASSYYAQQQFLEIIGWVYGAMLVLSVLCLIYSFIRRRDKREFDQVLGVWSGKLWLEVKLILACCAFGCLLALVGAFSDFGDPAGFVLIVTLCSAVTLLGCWWFYIMRQDLKVNRGQFSKKNLINSAIKVYRQYEQKYSWQQSMLSRTYYLIAAESALALLSVLFLLADGLPLALLIAGAGIYLLYRYMRHYAGVVDDLGRVTDHIESMKNGETVTKLELPDGSDMYDTAQNLNAIQEGMDTAVASRMKSERMKIELITNVSHDLKTPLTSIISYVDLLSKEEGLPEHVNDYVKILSQKSERLKNLIQDLFDLSRASSEDINLNLEVIDLARLVNQTMADMEEQIEKSGLIFRVNIPTAAVNIYGDGNKLYRVWENLISNTLKYALPGSRVYIDLVLENEGVKATIKNIANYEMKFTEDEILQRFVRGDEARTTEGSGLGLTIAHSFTELCQGKFSITIDGDLFKVEQYFKLVQ